MQLTANEQRVLGCLIEKKRTTPDTYPLSLNALRTACNQSSSRDPVMSLDDDDVREACTGLHGHGLVRIAAAGQGSRATKYRHTAGEALPATDPELALLAVLLLRGPQTRGELRTRTERIYPFESLEETGEVLDGLGMRGLVVLGDREPGAREARYTHQLGPRDAEIEAAAEEAAAEFRAQLVADGTLPTDDDPEAATPLAAAHDYDDAPAEAPRAPAAPQASTPPPPAPPAAAAPGVDPALVAALLDRIAALEQRVDDLEELVAG